MSEGSSKAISSIISAVASFGIIGAAIGGFVMLQNLKAEPGQKDKVSETPAVLFDRVHSHSQGFDVEVDGLVVPHREIGLPAEVAGQILEKQANCRAGNYVQQGDLLYRVDPRDYELEVQRLNNEKSQALAMSAEVDRELEGTYKLKLLSDQEVTVRAQEFERQERLKATNSTSDTELDSAQSQMIQAMNARQALDNQDSLLRARKVRLEAAQQLVETQLERAQLDLDRTEITAPISGVIVEDLVEKDDYVQKGAVLVRIEDTSKAEIQCKLEMQDLYWIWANQVNNGVEPSPGTPFQLPRAERVLVKYRLVGLRDQEYTWQGRLDRFDGFGLDEKTRTVPCRVVVDDPTQSSGEGPPALLRGMYVTVQIHCQPPYKLVRVTSDALRPGNQVWRVRDDVLDIIDIELIRMIPGDAESRDKPFALVRIHDGELSDGDRVVVSPLPYVRSGLTVVPHDVNEPSDATDSSVNTTESPRDTSEQQLGDETGPTTESN